MTTKKGLPVKRDLEFDAMQKVYAALNDLDTPARYRVLEYVARRLGLQITNEKPDDAGRSFSPQELAQEVREGNAGTTVEDAGDDLAGVSSVARKWIQRNGLSASQLSKVFSLGLDDIDVVARTVPGKSKKERMRNVLLLKATAAYLGTGAPRSDDASVREALGHYNAYDGANFATYMRDFGAEISGSKSGGYSLTARGLAAAAELVQSMTEKKS